MSDNQNDISGKVGLDVTDFKAAVADLNRQIRVVESGFKAAAAGMDDWRTTSTGLQSRIESLNKVTDLQRQKIGNLADEYLKIVEAKGKDSSAAENLEIKINKETAALNKNKAEIDNCKIALNNLDNESKRAAQGVEDLGKKSEEAEKKSGKMGSTFKDVSNNLGGATLAATKAVTGAVVGMGVAVVGAAAGAYKLAESASDLSEGQNVVEQVFKTSGKSVEDWTNTMANSAGISKTMATQWVGSMGAMMESSGLSEKASQSMSESLVKLTGDMSSFYNVSTDEMWEKIRSGISGETEPLKQLGINMDVANLQAYALSRGITKSYQSMSQSEQTTLRYNYLMNVTKNAQGDFGRTLSTSFANQIRVAEMNLKTLGQSIGQVVLPAFMNMSKGLNNMMGEINKVLGDGFQKGDLKKISTIISKALTDAIKDLNKEIPKIIAVVVPVLNSLVASIVQILPILLPKLLQGVLLLINGLISAIEKNTLPLVNLAINLVGQLADFIIKALPRLTVAAFNIISALVNAIIKNLPKLFSTGIQIITNIANSIGANLPKIAQSAMQIIEKLISGILQQLPKILQAAPQIILSLVTGIINSLPALITGAIKIISQLVDYITNNLDKIIAAAIKIIGAIASGLIQALPYLIPALIKLVAKIVIFLINPVNWIKIGVQIVKGIIEGLAGAAGELWDALGNMANKAVDKVKGALGIHSPSKVFADEVGHFIPSGIAVGITDNMDVANASMAGLTKGLVTQANADLKVNAYGSYKDTSNNAALNGPMALNSLVKVINDAISSNNTAKKQPVIVQLVTPDSKVFSEWLVDDLDLLQGKKTKILARGQGM